MIWDLSDGRYNATNVSMTFHRLFQLCTLERKGLAFWLISDNIIIYYIRSRSPLKILQLHNEKLLAKRFLFMNNLKSKYRGEGWWKMLNSEEIWKFHVTRDPNHFEQIWNFFFTKIMLKTKVYKREKSENIWNIPYRTVLV